jgi:DNA-binding winged helix-turn-helix (wHTH) protein
MADITFGPFTIDVDSGRVRRNGVDLRMRPQAFHVLRTLAAHGGRIIDFDQIIREAWNGTIVSRHTVHVTIAEVRRILDDRIVDRPSAEGRLLSSHPEVRHAGPSRLPLSPPALA